MPPKKDNSIVVALIGAAAVVIAALVGYFATHQNKIDQVSTNYTIKVKDSQSRNAIVNAQVDVTVDERAPQTYYTDSAGIVYVRLPSDTKTISLEVKASGYRNNLRSGLTGGHTGAQEILLDTLSPPIQPVRQCTGQHDEIFMFPAILQKDAAGNYIDLGDGGGGTRLYKWACAWNAPAKVTGVKCYTGRNQHVLAENKDGSTAKCEGDINGGNDPVRMHIAWDGPCDHQ